MIETIIQSRHWTDELAIWFIERDSGGSMQFYVDAKGKLLPGAYIKKGESFSDNPSLILSPDTLKSMVESAQGYIAPGPAVLDHLHDAVGVRDRLLALVEHTIVSGGVK